MESSSSSGDLFIGNELSLMSQVGRQALRDCFTPFDDDSIVVDGKDYKVVNSSNKVFGSDFSDNALDLVFRKTCRFHRYR